MRAVQFSAMLSCCLFGLAACDCDKKQTPPAPTSRSAPERTAPAEVNKRRAPTLAPVPTTALTPEDVISCEAAHDTLKKITCLASLAQRNRDPRYCDEVEKASQNADEKAPELVRSGTAANSCRRTIAYMRDDPSLCARITQAAMAGSCLSYFAMKRRSPEVCRTGGEGSEASMMCYLNEAARTRDPSLCHMTGKFQEDCNKRLGPLEGPVEKP